MFLSAALMLRHGLGMENEAAAVESAVDRALADGLRTRDLGGSATTDEAAQAVSEPPLRSPIVDQADLIWMNGELVAWEDAKVHVLTHCLHYGTGVFEGMRAYETERGTAIFRHVEHLDRLYKSAELYYMPIPYTPEELRAAVHEVVAQEQPAVLLHPPDRLPRHGRDGDQPARGAGRRGDRRMAVGRLPRRGSEGAAACARRSRAGGGSAPTR